MGKTQIEWTGGGYTWNPWWGCSKVGHECDHCYAIREASRKMQPVSDGLTADGEWTGRINRNSESVWNSPIKWKKPAFVFTCSMSDFWHEDVPIEWLAEAFDVIEATPHLTYQILTKRPGNIARKLAKMKRKLPQNVWLGLSIGHKDSLPLSQPFRRLDVPNLKFLSCEPLLTSLADLDLGGVGWVIAGGESGPGYRLTDPEWARGLRAKCSAAEIPFFFKQWGNWQSNPTPRDQELDPHASKGGATLDGRLWREFPPLPWNTVQKSETETRMSKHNGYDGGDSEPELIKAANETLAEDQLDTVEKIKKRYWKLGAILETAIARGYCKTLSVKGWVAVNLKCSYVHANACRKAWQQRHAFDDALRWYRENNTGWQPSRPTGPTFAIELVKAFGDRDKPEKPPKEQKSHSKDALEAAKKWRDRYKRLADEHAKIAQRDGWTPTTLNQIAQEIAAEEGEAGGKAALPAAPATETEKATKRQPSRGVQEPEEEGADTPQEMYERLLLEPATPKKRTPRNHKVAELTTA